MKDRTSQRVVRGALTALLVAVPTFVIACGDEGDAGDGGSVGGGGTGARSGSSGDEGGEGGGAGTSGGGSSENGGTGADNGGQGGDAPRGGGGNDGGSGDVGGHGGEPPGTTCDLSGENKPLVLLKGDIERDMALDSSNDYLLTDVVRIKSGATLTIPPCTRIEGTPPPKVGLLVAERGARLVAMGERDDPILFTSNSPAGRRAAGQWGGIVLLGRAPLIAAGGAKENKVVGMNDPADTYGAENPDPNDDSGILRYVRIEFAGFAQRGGESIQEVNGLTIAGVGRGTTIDHVMVSGTLDDCFEWLGGTAKAEYLVANNCGDEDFAAAEDWQGGGRYWFGRRAFYALSGNSPNGLELTGIVEDMPTAVLPLSHLTLCGVGQDSYTAEQSHGMVLGGRLKGSIADVALAGFDFAIDTRGQFEMAALTVRDSTFWDFVYGLDNGVKETEVINNDDAGFVDHSVLTDEMSNDLEPNAPPFTVGQCLELGAPGSAVLESGVGAFADGADWMRGAWVDWSEE